MELTKLKNYLPIALVFILVVIFIISSQPPQIENKQKHSSDVYAHLGTVGKYSDADPSIYLKSWNFNDLPDSKRQKSYKETPLSDGTLLREYWIYAEDKQIEIAPGV
ncbi:hypothetical protein HYT84_01165, partial [Candidatus Micrarchaeota archaeon]|nr:hypothetical protein [Candidatus Micrarchaeota archaeon]